MHTTITLVVHWKHSRQHQVAEPSLTSTASAFKPNLLPVKTH